jgi:hypothetical protein
MCRKDAAPITHARAEAPPFLILYGDRDLPACGKVPSEAFCRALCEKNCKAISQEIKERNHFTILMNANQETDPLARAVLGFVSSHVTK